MSQVTHSPIISRSLDRKGRDVLIAGRAFSSLNSGVFSRTLVILRNAREAAAHYLALYGRANAAENTYQRLRAMSDADLAKLGIKREQISEYVKRQLF